MTATAAIGIDLRSEEQPRSATWSSRLTIQIEHPTNTDLPAKITNGQRDFCVMVLDELRKVQRDLGWCPKGFAEIRRSCLAKIREQEAQHGAD